MHLLLLHFMSKTQLRNCISILIDSHIQTFLVTLHHENHPPRSTIFWANIVL